MTLLDLDKGSLKVGSADACQSVPHGALDDTERTVNEDMCAVARHIGLAVHEVKVDGKLVASFPRTSALLNSVKQDGAGGAVPLCTTVALTVAPGDHQIAVRVKSASKKHAVVSQLIWW